MAILIWRFWRRQKKELLFLLKSIQEGLIDLIGEHAVEKKKAWIL
jgi:hypothetical protein